MAGSASIASAIRICSGVSARERQMAAPRLRAAARPALVRSRDHVALELGERGKDVKRQLAGGRCRVEGFLEGP